MAYDLSKLLVVGVSSRALFDLEEEERIFQKRGIDDYRYYQLEHENQILDSGTAFPLIKGLLSLNRPGRDRLVEVIVVSRNLRKPGLGSSIPFTTMGLTSAGLLSSEAHPLSITCMPSA